jgi:hypothetical protein
MRDGSCQGTGPHAGAGCGRGNGPRQP